MQIFPLDGIALPSASYFTSYPAIVPQEMPIDHGVLVWSVPDNSTIFAKGRSKVIFSTVSTASTLPMTGSILVEYVVATNNALFEENSKITEPRHCMHSTCTCESGLSHGCGHAISTYYLTAWIVKCMCSLTRVYGIWTCAGNLRIPETFAYRNGYSPGKGKRKGKGYTCCYWQNH